MKPLQPAIYNPADRKRAIADMVLAFRQDPDKTRNMCGLGPKGTEEDVIKATTDVLDDETRNSEVWLNDKYQVTLRRFPSTKEGGPEMVHLSIKRIDKEVCKDWRDFQAIKNQLVGAECEGMELYPAESRVVDTANQYHLWVINDPTFRYPWGFDRRAVMPPTPGTASKQRGFEE